MPPGRRAAVARVGDLVEAGVVPELGISNMGPRRLRRWHGLLQQRGLRISSLQVQFSLLATEPRRLVACWRCAASWALS